MRNNNLDILKKTLWIQLILLILLPFSLWGKTTVKIMPLGDSITEGGIYGHSNENESNTFVAYRGALWSKLTSAGYQIDFVGSNSGGQDYKDNNDSTFDTNHEGHNGKKADEIDEQITTYLEKNPPNIVLLHIGTNDLKQGEGSPSTITDIGSILDKIKAHNSNTSVIIARIINRLTHDQETTTFNNDLNTMLQQRISTGDNVTIVNMENDANINYQTEMIDGPLGGLHPNASGYSKMANLWFSTLKTLIPTHLWNLDETSTTTFADIYREANGTCGSACPTADINGQIIGAQSFDGTNEINVNDTSTLNWGLNDSFTIDFWMKTDTSSVSVNGRSQNNIMIGRGDGSQLSWFVGIDGSGVGGGSTNTINFGLFDSNDAVHSSKIFHGKKDVVDNRWHHIACVRDASTNENRIYVDGDLSAKKTITYDTNFDEGNTSMNIGWLNWIQPNNNQKFYYDGQLDQIRIFNAALHQEQIKRYYHKTQSPKPIITSIPVKLAELNVPYSYDVNTTNDPKATFELKTSPSWLSIDSDTGLISGAPDTIGNFDVEINTIDDTQTPSQSSTQNYTLRVRQQSILPSTMKYYWKLDETEDNRSYFESYQGMDGSCLPATDCPISEPNGMMGGAQRFDGRKKIDVRDTTGLNFSKDASFTIELWMKTNTATANGKNNVMIGRADSTKLSWFIAANKDKSGKVLFGLFDSNDLTPTTAQIDGNVSIIDDKWHHIVCVRDGNSNENMIYVDGNLSGKKSVTYDAGFEQGSLPLRIGHLKWNNFRYNGLLDEVSIFDDALTPTEIQEHYQNGIKGLGFELDTTPPVITLTGANPQIIEMGTAYTELGATANDNVDGNITTNIVIDASTVDTNISKSYIVTYDVNDSSGNPASKIIRTVKVVDTNIDTDGDGIPDASDPDDDNDGILDNADADVNGDGTMDNGPDSDGNGINDTNDPSWFTYVENNDIKTVTIASVSSTIVAEDKNATIEPNLTNKTVTLKVKNINGCTAYIEASKNGGITTGYEGSCQNAGDTLKDRAAFPIGTKSVIKSKGASIESTVKLNMNESFIIGGK